MPPPSRSTFSTPLRFQSHHSTRSSTSYPLARIRASIPRRRRAIRSPGGVDSVASTPPGGSCGTLGRLEPPTKWPTDLIDSYLPSPLLLSRLFLPSSRSWLSYVDHHRHRHRRHHRRRHRHRRRAVPCRAAPAGPPASRPTDLFPDSFLLRFSTRYSFKRPPKDATPLFAQHRLLRQFLPRTSNSRFFLPLYDLDSFFPLVRPRGSLSPPSFHRYLRSLPFLYVCLVVSCLFLFFVEFSFDVYTVRSFPQKDLGTDEGFVAFCF